MPDEIDLGEVRIEADGVPPVDSVWVLMDGVEDVCIGQVRAEDIPRLVAWLQQQLRDPQ